MRKLREIKKNQKGFTLIEVIVVLVILGIMAAIAVPSFVGYVDKAKEHQIISETRQIVQAVQMITSEGYAKDKSYEPNFGDPSETVLTANAIKNLCEIDVSSGLTVTFDSTNKVKIDTLTWTNGSTCTYNGGTYTVS